MISCIMVSGERERGAHMGKTSSRVKDRYNAKAYDEIKLRVPKGLKAAVEDYARSRALSTNALLNELLREAMDVPQEAWKAQTAAVEPQAAQTAAEPMAQPQQATTWEATEQQADAHGAARAGEAWTPQRPIGKSSGCHVRNAAGRPCAGPHGRGRY